ncbi:chaperone protein DnaJ [Spatholobus suberectus]|nr:chaperone protein DnaJ [Spatholobus suberectus]
MLKSGRTSFNAMLILTVGCGVGQCKSSMIARENCALRCLSPACYELIYESDPLEEGEKDFIRSQEYKYCMHKLSVGESLEGVKGAFSH